MDMSEDKYIEPMQRGLHQQGLKALLIVQFATVLPFIEYLPPWLLVAFALVVYWRRRVFRGHLQRPPKWMIISALVTGIGAMLLSGLNRYSLDSAVAFCVLGYLLKSLEVLRRRDGVFQVYLGYFLAGVFLLYRFDPVAGLILVILLFLNTVALQAVTSESHFKWGYSLKQSSILILAAIPVMLAGYLFFPRLPPLWQIPNEQRGAQTGMTDEINPGEIAELARSRDPAFRVSFEGSQPPRDQWYWRGSTMSEFNGRSWKAKSTNSSVGRSSLLPAGVGQIYNYNVIAEKSGREWLYFLDWPTQITGRNIQILADGRGAAREPLNNVFQYHAQSSFKVEWPDQKNMLVENTKLPVNGNEELRQWSLNQRASVRTDKEFVALLLNYIRSEKFYYTLKPPTYPGRHSLSDFWLNGRRGFCSHYASSLGYILRSVDIPTRLVGGYVGGKFNENGNYIQVRQMEAHAWVEVWLNNHWVRIDPTAAVAPSRVQMNLDELFSETQPGELNIFTRMNQFSAINKLSMYWDSIQYQWQILVLNYENDTAIGWFESAFGRFTPLKAAIAVLTLLAIVALILAATSGMLILPRIIPEPFRTLYRVEKKFGERMPQETIRQYFTRLGLSSKNNQEFAKLEGLIEKSLYGQPNNNIHSELKLVGQKLGLSRRYFLSRNNNYR